MLVKQIHFHKGDLYIKREEKLIKQLCPFASERRTCGLFCPMIRWEQDKNSYVIRLRLCNNVVYEVEPRNFSVTE